MPWVVAVASVAGTVVTADSARKSRKAQNSATAANGVLTEAQMKEDARRFDLDRQDKWDLFNAQMAGDEEMDRRNRADKEQSYQRVRGDNVNAMGRGDAAGNQLSYLMGTGNEGVGEKGWLSRRFGEGDMVKDAGYQFRMQEGQNGVTNKFAQSGNLLSGAAMKALNRFNQEYASNEYGNAYSRYNLDQEAQYNRLSGIQAAGQNAVNSTAGNSGTVTGQASNAMSGLANSLGQTSAQQSAASSNYYNNLMGNNNAKANSQSAYNNAYGNAIGGGLGSVASSWNSYQNKNNAQNNTQNYSYPTQNHSNYEYLDF